MRAGVLAELWQKAGELTKVRDKLVQAGLHGLASGVSREVVNELAAKLHEVGDALQDRSHLGLELAPLVLELLAHFEDAARTMRLMPTVIVNTGLAVELLAVVGAGVT